MKETTVTYGEEVHTDHLRATSLQAKFLAMG